MLRCSPLISCKRLVDRQPRAVVVGCPERSQLVVRAEDVIHNMHQAYERLEFREAGFGTFIAGPSKTADVEQSLVIGAHGPRSQTVFVVG